MTMRFNGLAAGLVGAGLMVGGAVEAAQVTQTITVPTQTTDLNAVPFSDSIGLFNSRLGTLTDVRLTLGSTLNTSGNLTNTASQAQTFQFDLRISGFTSAGGTVGSGAGAQTVVLGQFGQFQANTQVTDFGTSTYTLNPGQAGAYPTGNNGTMTGSSAVTLTDASSLAAFTGAGSFGLAANTTTSQTFTGGGGNIATNLVTTAAETFTVVYDYTPPTPPVTTVPEPASMAVLAAGLLGIGMVRRRRA